MNVRELITTLQREDPEAIIVVEGPDHGAYDATCFPLKVERYADGSLSLHDPDYPAAGCEIVSAIMITTGNR